MVPRQQDRTQSSPEQASQRLARGAQNGAHVGGDCHVTIGRCINQPVSARQQVGQVAVEARAKPGDYEQGVQTWQASDLARRGARSVLLLN